MKRVDVKTVLDKAKAKELKAKVSYTLDADLVEQFRLFCGKERVAQSRVLEELIRELLGKG